MTDSVTLPQVAALAAQLPAAERRQLAESLLATLEIDAPPQKSSWAALRGSMPHPMLGEDAQTVISRERREDTERREALLRRDG